MRSRSLSCSSSLPRWQSLFPCRSKSLPIRPMPVTTRVRSGISCSCSNLLKYFEGPLEVVGTFVIPTVGFILLLFLPFLDRKEERTSLLKRPVALTVTSLSVVLIVLLTVLGCSLRQDWSLPLKNPPRPSKQHRVKMRLRRKRKRMPRFLISAWIRNLVRLNDISGELPDIV